MASNLRAVSLLTATLCFVRPLKASGSLCDPSGTSEQAGSCSRNLMDSSGGGR